MSTKNIVELVRPMLEGQISIKQLWDEYGTEIRAVEKGSSYDEVMSLTCAYHRYGIFLAEKGYFNDSLIYFDDALTILTKGNNFVLREQFDEFQESILNYKANVLAKLERYNEALACLKELKVLCPAKDEYRLHYDNCYQAMINKKIYPCYVIVAVVWAICLIDGMLLDTDYIPGWVSDIGWYVWIILIVMQFVLPWVKRKLDK